MRLLRNTTLDSLRIILGGEVTQTQTDTHKHAHITVIRLQGRGCVSGACAVEARLQLLSGCAKFL